MLHKLRDNSFKPWFNIALLCFVLAALAGCVLRLIFVTDLGAINYKYFLNGHSHLAMLGWVFGMLFLYLVAYHLNIDDKRKAFYLRLFVILEITALVMFVSFLFTGYKTLSIILSTVHLLLSYFFAFHFLRDSSSQKGTSLQIRFARTAIWMMIFSSLGVWALGVSMGIGLKGTAFYYGTIQFFLHFQFNGWFLLGALSLLFTQLEPKTSETKVWANRFYFLILLSVFLTFAQAISWSTPLKVIFYINSLGVFVQLAAIYYFIKIISRMKDELFEGFGFREAWLLRIAVFSLCLKVFSQTIVAIPEMAEVSYTVRNFIIGFIHLINLAFLSLLFFAFASKLKWLNVDRVFTRFGLQCAILGIFLTEFALFGQGIFLWLEMGFVAYYYEWIFGFSALLAFGLILILMDQLRHKSTIEPQ